MESRARHRPHRGAATRSRIRKAAMGLLREHGPGVTVSAISEAAEVYPNQITHHFGSKDALVIEASFNLLLLDTERIQSAGRHMRTPESFRAAIARTAMHVPSMPHVVAALAIAQDNPPAQPTLRTLIDLLFRQSERYLERIMSERSWVSEQGVARDVRTFWSAIFGAVLVHRAGVPGGPSDIDLASTLTVRRAD